MEWRRRPPASRIAMLLGAFDPPTNAHLEILDGAAIDGRTAAWGMTRHLLDRSGDGLFTFDERVEIVGAIATRKDAAFALFPGGTYIEADRALRAEGFDATFVIGSDKIEQLRDPSFYPDGVRGVDATFAEVSFVVVEREASGLSATLVRRRWAEGSDISGLVPPEVTQRLPPRGQGYTSAR